MARLYNRMGSAAAASLVALAACTASAQTDPAVTGAGVPAAVNPSQFSAQELQEMFDRVLTRNMPADPSMIDSAIKRADETGRAAERPGAKPVTALLPISLDPATPVPVVNVDLNQVTTISFTDASGEPWPIVNLARSAGITGPEPTKGSHVVRIEPKTAFETASLSVDLEGLATPIAMQVKAGGTEYHGRAEARVPRLGPHAKPPLWDMDTGMQAGDAVLISFLQGVPPAGAVSLPLGGSAPDTRAWRIGGDVYVRTPLTLLAPHPRAQQRLEGVYVYKIGAVPVLKFSDGGMVVDVKIQNSAAIVRASTGGRDGQ